jgi:hypothetical protein
MSCAVSCCAVLCSAKALSKYTDMVDSISREQLNRLAEATDAARLALKQVGGRSLLCSGPRCFVVGIATHWGERYKW